MLRVTVVGVALAISMVACNKSDRNAATTDTAMGGMAPAGTTSAAPPSTTDTTRADTTGAMAPGATDTSTSSGALDTMANRAGAAGDTLANRAGQAAEKAKAAAAGGAAAVGNAMVGNAPSMQQLRTKLSALNKDQVQQLQTALNNDGCDVGTPDGKLGANTLKGVQCAMKKHNVNDIDSLYQALNLNFK
ncbi:MAG TPA: hypothetical protein VFR95_01365 [Gemmatimonadaceae bacterium]|nr:hypothetical protein [Gemmatimonadaceae bacterium]